MKHMALVISIVLAIAIVGVTFQITQAQRSRRQPTQAQQPQRQFSQRINSRFRVIQAVENTWAALAFEVKVDDETLKKIRPAFQKAWDKRKKLIKNSAGDFRAIVEGMTKTKADIDKKLKEVLTEEQMKKLAEWEKTQRQQPDRDTQRP